MINKRFNELATNSSFYVDLLKEHIIITFTAVIIDIIIGLSVGILISHKPEVAGYVMLDFQGKCNTL